jgi:hypothetical protein
VVCDYDLLTLETEQTHMKKVAILVLNDAVSASIADPVSCSTA